MAAEYAGFAVLHTACSVYHVSMRLYSVGSVNIESL